MVILVAIAPLRGLFWACVRLYRRFAHFTKIVAAVQRVLNGKRVRSLTSDLIARTGIVFPIALRIVIVFILVALQRPISTPIAVVVMAAARVVPPVPSGRFACDGVTYAARVHHALPSFGADYC